VGHGKAGRVRYCRVVQGVVRRGSPGTESDGADRHGQARYGKARQARRVQVRWCKARWCGAGQARWVEAVRVTDGLGKAGMEF